MLSKNKKAILMPETLKIILAVIGISILIYLAVGLYGIFFGKGNEIEQAKSSLNIISSNIDIVENEEQNSVEFLIESPNNWWVITWPYQDEKEKPTVCQKDYCVCLCPYAPAGRKQSLDYCDIKGVCKDVSKPIYTLDETAVFKETPLKIDGVINLNISLKDGQFVIRKI